MSHPPLTTEFVGMTVYSLTSFHDLFSDDNLLSEDSSVGDVSSPGCLVLQECAMADVQATAGLGGDRGHAHPARPACTGPG
jgi:hypothetical protein